MTVVALHIDSPRTSWANALIASLPASLKQVEREASDLILVDGQADWPARVTALLKAGHRKFLLTDPEVPSQSDLAGVIALADKNDASIDISEKQADNPAVAVFQQALSGSYTSVTIQGKGSCSIANLVLQQLRLARRCGIHDLSLLNSCASEHAAICTLEAKLQDTPVMLRLSMVQSEVGCTSHRLMTHGQTQSACIEIESRNSARPAAAFVVTSEGQSILPTLYEHAHRAALRKLIGNLEQALGTRAIREWQSDLVLANALIERT